MSLVPSPFVRSLLATAAALALAGAAQAAVTYQSTLIGTLPGFDNATPFDLNDAGTVVGTATGPNGAERAFAFRDGVLVDLGALAGGNGNSSARAIAADGRIVGSSRGGSVTQAVQWLPGSNQAQALSSSASSANAIGATGRAFGAQGNGGAGLGTDAVRFSAGTATVVLNNAVADGVNAQGSVVGMRGGPNGTASAFRLRGNTLEVMPSLPGANGVTRALAINDQEVVVGVGVNASGQDRALRWSAAGAVQDLGVFAAFAAKGQASVARSFANDVNASGAIVGGTTTANSLLAPMLWTERRGMQLLPVSLPAGVSLGAAMAVNDLGQIVAGSSAGAVLLTPTGSLSFGAVSGNFADTARWTGAFVSTGAGPFDPGVAPNRFIDALMPARISGLGTISRVATMDRDTTLKSLVLGSPGTGAADGSRIELRLAAPGGVAGPLPTLKVLGTASVQGGGTLAGSGTIEGNLAIARTPAGPGRLAVGDLRVIGSLRNQGEIGMIGSTADVRLRASLDNEATGRLVVAPDRLFVLDGETHSNAGTVLVEGRGGLLRVDGRMANLASGQVDTRDGAIEFLDRVDNAGTMQANLRGRLRFFDEVVNNGVIHADFGGIVTFAGRVSGEGAFTGPGSFVFEAGFAPGNSPAAVFVENAVFNGGDLVMELGGHEPGAEHDRIDFGGQVTFAGGTALKIGFADGFRVQAGDRFQLFDFGGAVSGTLDLDQLPVLGDGLAWDRRDVMAGGWLGVSAVPEPQSWLLMALGGAALAWRRRRAAPAWRRCRAGLGWRRCRDAGAQPCA
jgi:probable HAF family extracellular repeat protein